MGNVSVALVDAQHRQCTLICNAPEGQPGADTRASCVAKLFTATLLSNLLVRAGIGLSREVAECLPLDGVQRRGLAGVSFTHLIDHSHGLDDSALTHCPVAPDGTVDAGALCRDLLAAPPLFEPGELHSYGSAGAYLAGAAIEHLYGRPFCDVLEQELLGPLGILLREAADGKVPKVCPANGGRWLLSARELAQLLAVHLEMAIGGSPGVRGHPDLMQADSRPLPGWNPTELGIRFGWKDYGGAWYGHDGRWSGSSLLGRINTRRRVAIAIGATDFTRRDPVYAILEGLFGEQFPEVAGIRVPMLLSAEEAQRADREAFKGVYEARTCAVAVFEEGGQLLLRIEGRSASRTPPGAYRLRAAQENVFMTSPSGLELFPYVQFLRPSRSGRYQYLWNGQNLWRRARSALDGSI